MFSSQTQRLLRNWGLYVAILAGLALAKGGKPNVRVVNNNAATQSVIFVDTAATGPIHDGSTWCQAYANLQDAFDIAATTEEIRVADGTYTPDRGTRDRNATFQFPNGVSVLGGFAGCNAVDPNARDITAFETVLSGDLAGDDNSSFGNHGENSYHVVSATGTDATTILEGFTIRGGNASDSPSDPHGGGIHGGGGALTVRHCLVTMNIADSGAGVYLHAGIIEDCTISRNTARQEGGGLALCSGTILRCTVSRNLAIVSGGGVHGCTGTIANSIISGNTAGLRGGGLSQCEASVVNSTITGNSANETGGAVADCTGAFTNCVFWDNINPWWAYSFPYPTYSCVPSSGIPGPGIYAGDPLFVVPGYRDNVGGWIDGDYHLLPGSPCIDAGDNTVSEVVGLTTDLAEFTRFFDDIHTPDVGNPGTTNLPIVDMGAYEFGDCNGNMLPDPQDISGGISADCNGNDIPDECIAYEADCNDNAVPDQCDLDAGNSEDCTGNAVPDECEPDCNINGFADTCDLFNGTSDDCNDNAVPDECDIVDQTSLDNVPPGGDDIPDECQLDCNANGILDDADILTGTSPDCDANGIPDECQWNLIPGDPRPLNSNADSDSEWDGAVRLATDAHGNWITVWTSFEDLNGRIGNDTDILYARSTDYGITWTDPFPLNTFASIDNSIDYIGSIVTDGQGNWLVTWTSEYDIGGIGTDRDILFSRSVNNGISWSTPSPLNADAYTGYQGYSAQPVTYGNGTWITAWTSHFHFWMNRSIDNGVTWSQQTEFSTCAQCRNPRIATDNQGIWVMVWSENRSDSNISVSHSWDNGETWAPGRLLHSFSNDLAVDQQIATDGQGNWITVWSSRSVGDYFKILYSRSTDNGATWSEPTPLDSGGIVGVGDQRYPDITTDKLGHWVVGWTTQNIPNGKTGNVSVVHWSVSVNAGLTWSVPLETGNKWSTTLTPDGRGRWVAAWASSDDLGGTIGSDLDILTTTLSNVHDDCNNNGTLDECDLAEGTSLDCNSNGIPDQCDPNQDCNTNGIQDTCDIANGTSDDCNHNEIPDECEANQDCNGNGIQDICDVADGSSDDCDAQGIPDECKPDCNGNGYPDSCDVNAMISRDCNGNAIPDECDIANGTSDDNDGDGFLDECQRILNVPSPEYTTIQAAMDSASEGDTVLVAPGTYTGEGNRDLNFGGRPFLVRCAGAPGTCIIDCEDSGRAFAIELGETADSVVDGFTITRGRASFGAGIYIYLSNPTIKNCTFYRNDTNASPYRGGGIGIIGAPTIDGCVFTENTASSGGGMYIGYEQTAHVKNCKFNSNSAGAGGGIYTYGAALIESCTFNANTAQEGAGIYNDRDSLATIINSIFVGNTVQNSFNNANGAGMYNNWCSPTVINCTFSKNTAQRSGGAIYNRNTSSPHVSNCILWGNVESGEGGLGEATVTFSNIEGGHPGTGNIDVDPLFTDPVAHDFHLLPGSPCINAGDPDFQPTLTQTDIDGQQRVQQCRVDMGVAETPFYVDCNANALSDACEILDTTVEDCNRNGVPDECDIAGGASADCNPNGVPDECESDCNENGQADACDIVAGLSKDCDGNSVPDECEPDCNENGIADPCEIVDGTSPDLNKNGKPDECDPINDLCENALQILAQLTLFDGTHAVLDGPTRDEIPACDISCSPPCYFNDIWYEYVAPCTGLIELDAFSLELNRVNLNLYEGCDCPVAPNSAIACQWEHQDSSTLFQAVEGTCYKIQLEALMGYLFLQAPAGCTQIEACCTADGSCQNLDADPCIFNGGTPGGVESACEGDFDQDGLDGACGDPCPLDNPNDTDGDGVCDSDDLCQGFDDNLDTDGDGTPDCSDNCPLDPEKLEPGICGCGVSDIDTDSNMVADCLEPEVIPTLTAWGAVVLTLLLLVTSRLYRDECSELQLHA